MEELVHLKNKINIPPKEEKKKVDKKNWEKNLDKDKKGKINTKQNHNLSLIIEIF
jgi:hypothetical protein